MVNPLSGDITIPKVGSVPKAVVIPLAAGSLAYIGYRYWSASRDYAGETEEDTSGTYEDGETIPAVEGAYSATNAYGYGSSSTDTEGSGFTGTTNSAWSQYVSDNLVASDKWDYTDIVTALGSYLGGKALSTTEQAIVRSGIALAGNPPEGTHPIIPGGDTEVSVAPTGLTASTIGTTTVDLTWAAVPGASGYRVYRSGASQNVGASADTTHQVGGLQPGKKYTFTVAAVGVGSQVGPKSSAVSVTTKTVSVKAPTSLKASNVTKSSVTLNWKAAESASFYRIYVNGVARGTSEDTVHTVGALKPGTKYKIQVKSDSTGGKASAPATVSVTTKRK